MNGSDVSDITGSDVSDMTGSDVIGMGPDRKYVLRMPGFFPRFFLSSRTRCDQRSLDPLRSSFECAQPEVAQHP